MYRAKSLGKARYEVFDADMRASVMARLQLETDLRRALERERIPEFLPADRLSGFRRDRRLRVACCAGSIRLRGTAQPRGVHFVAEETGLIRELGWWSLREACRQMRRLESQLPTPYRDLIVSVNLSVKQFVQPNLVEDIAAMLKELDLPPTTLKAGNYRKHRDGGSGGRRGDAAADQSSGYPPGHRRFRHWLFLAELSAPVPARYVENRPLVHQRHAGDGVKGMEIARTIMPMAKNLRLDVVAEGVETADKSAS